MKNAPAKSAGKKVTEVEPFDKRSVDFTKFKPDLTAKELQKLFGPKGGLVVFPFGPIETLSSTKTIGRGRTNLTIIMSTIVQIDSNIPNASLDPRATPSRNPIIQMHFEPIAYAIPSAASVDVQTTTGYTRITQQDVRQALETLDGKGKEGFRSHPPGG